jgi:hypothetical protein
MEHTRKYSLARFFLKSQVVLSFNLSPLLLLVLQESLYC